MTSIRTPSPQLHEQLVGLRLNTEHEVAASYDSDNETLEAPKDRPSSQALYTKFRALERENETLKQEIARLRARRNDYRQESHQLKGEVDSLRLQLNKREDVYDSDAEHAEQARKPGILRFDPHSFNRTTTSTPPFVTPVPPTPERPLLPYADTASHAYHIKYPDIDDFYGDREKWEQWREDLLTKIWTCPLQFPTEQHKINYARRHTKGTAYDIIKTRARIDSESPYSTIDELLKDLHVSFGQAEDIKQRKAYAKVFDDNFRMAETEKFETFITRYTAAVAGLQIIDEVLIHQLKMKLSPTLRHNIWHLAGVHEYQKFVEGLRYAAIGLEELRLRRSEHKSYSGPYPLTRKEKEQLDDIGGCYKCHQPGHKASDRDAPCKHTPWMLEEKQ